MSTEKTKRTPLSDQFKRAPLSDQFKDLHPKFEGHLNTFMNRANDGTTRYSALEAMLEMAAEGYHRRGQHLLYNEVDAAIREVRNGDATVADKLAELKRSLFPTLQIQASKETQGKATLDTSKDIAI